MKSEVQMMRLQTWVWSHLHLAISLELAEPGLAGSGGSGSDIDPDQVTWRQLTTHCLRQSARRKHGRYEELLEQFLFIFRKEV